MGGCVSLSVCVCVGGCGGVCVFLCGCGCACVLCNTRLQSVAVGGMLGLPCEKVYASARNL